MHSPADEGAPVQPMDDAWWAAHRMHVSCPNNLLVTFYLAAFMPCVETDWPSKQFAVKTIDKVRSG